MHRALQIDEILCHIFLYFSPSITHLPRIYYSPEYFDAQTRIRASASSLAPLARTCRAFKEPALDVLWSVLGDSSPLARCLPEASYWSKSLFEFSFARPLIKDEWDTLQSYTRRIQSIIDFKKGLDLESVRTYLNPPATDPLFPKLRHLHCRYTEGAMILLCLPLPSLVTLDVGFEDDNPPESFPNSSPNISELTIRRNCCKGRFGKIKPDYLFRWQNLSSVVCPDVLLNMDDLVHLARMPALTRLDIALDTTLRTSDSLIIFSDLHELALSSESLEPILRLLSQIRLPTLTYVHVQVEDCPSQRDFTSFFSGAQTSNATYTIKKLVLLQSHNGRDSEGLLELGFEDLHLCMAFSNLRHVVLDVGWSVRLTSAQVLVLASAWPNLEHLSINADWSWNARAEHGITLDGLVQLFQTCPLLCHVALCFNTVGYTEASSRRLPASFGLTLPSLLQIDAIDSVIEAESVAAVAAFIRRLAACCSKLTLGYWNAYLRTDHLRRCERMERWADVVNLACDALRPPSGS